MTILHLSSCGNALALTPVMVRILFGPFPVQGVVSVYYVFRIIVTFIISLLTIKMVLMAAFLVKFDRMSGEVMKYEIYLNTI